MADETLLQLTAQALGAFKATYYQEFASPDTSASYRARIQDLVFAGICAGVLPTWAPQGRLTLSSVPVMVSDAVGVTTVYYLPFVGQWVPIWGATDGVSGWIPYSIGAQLALTLSTSAHLNGNVYDVFVFSNSGTPTIGAGPAWSSGSSRGTGAGTTQISQPNGLWVNTNAITLTNGASTYANIPANQATYLGSFYCTANGQTTMQLNATAAAGGTTPVVGLFNAYNQVKMRCNCRDSNVSVNSYTVSVANTWQAAAANSNINILDGLGQMAATFFGAVYAFIGTSQTLQYGIDEVGQSSPGQVFTLTSSGGSSTYQQGTCQDGVYPNEGIRRTLLYVNGSSTSSANVAYGNTYLSAEILN